MAKECRIDEPTDVDCVRCGAEKCDARIPMRNTDEGIFRAVLEAMQHAEDLGGPNREEYVALMTRIAAEANRRAAIADCQGCQFQMDDGCLIGAETVHRPCQMRLGESVKVKVIKG